jgi:hypothetical protein
MGAPAAAMRFAGARTNEAAELRGKTGTVRLIAVRAAV